MDKALFLSNLEEALTNIRTVAREEQKAADEARIRQAREAERRAQKKADEERKAREERQREQERQRQQELERQREVERQRAAERERQRIAEEKRKQEEREAQIRAQKKAEDERKAREERQRELERQRIAEQERQREIQRQKALEEQRAREEQERQRELERQRATERQRFEDEKKAKEQQKRKAHEAELAKELEEPITQPLPFASNGLFVFLDKGNEVDDRIGVVGSGLLTALNQQAGPILASAGLIRDIVKQPSLQELIDEFERNQGPDYQIVAGLNNPDLIKASSEFAKIFQTVLKTLDQLLKEIPTYELPMLPHLYNEKFDKLRIYLDQKTIFPGFKKAVFKEYSSFNADEWIVKKVSPDHLLLIPKNYLETIKKKNNFAQHYKKEQFSVNELNLGLKIDHMEDVASLEKFAQDYRHPSAYNVTKSFVELLPSLFITRPEYQKEKAVQRINATQMPQWVFYLVGHGASGIVIAGIPLDQFKEILNFFDTKITTKLFVYDSCYASGVTADIVYKDQKSAIYRSYSYAIASGALTDAPTSGKTDYVPLIDIKYEDIDIAKKRIRPRSLYHYDKFMQEVTTETTLDFPKTLANLLPGAAKIEDKRDIFNLPQLKLPGVPWFNIADTQNKVVSIGAVLAFSRSADQPLDIMKFFNRKMEPEAILLYANIFPFPLIIPTKTMPSLVSMVPGDAVHKFNKVSIRTSFAAFADSFKNLARSNINKLYWISELEFEAFYRKINMKNIVVLIQQSFIGIEPKISVYFTDEVSKSYEWLMDKQEAKEYNYEWLFKSLEETSYKFAKAAEQAEEKMGQAELIRKAQEKKIREIREKKAKESAKTAHRTTKRKQRHAIA